MRFIFFGVEQHDELDQPDSCKGRISWFCHTTSGTRLLTLWYAEERKGREKRKEGRRGEMGEREGLSRDCTFVSRPPRPEESHRKFINYKTV